MRITRRVYPLAVALAVLGAALLILQWAHGRMLWLDEEMIAINVRDRSFSQLAGRLSLGQAAPYGWLAAERAFLLTAGSGERALRFVPMAFGVVSVMVALWIGSRWFSSLGAATLVFLCVFGQWLSFHHLELKHYSADVCFGLLLPALVVWALESAPAEFPLRAMIWWVVASASQWISNGALFVAPGSAAVLVGAAVYRFGSRVALRAAAPGVIWAASFALNYSVALGPARSSEYLQQYWRWALPPRGSGLPVRLRWLASQFGPLAIKPGGSGFTVGFWMAAAIGFVFGRARSSAAVFGLVFALAPGAAFVWAGIGLVPLSERLSLWMVPAVYVGIALAVELAVRLLTVGIRQRGVIRAGIAAVTIAALVVLLADVHRRGMIYLHLTPAADNHELDDRAAVMWLARQQRSGDVWIGAPYTALPAIWWYANPDAATPVLEASMFPNRATCGDSGLAGWLAANPARRALVYFGFAHDATLGLDAALMSTLGDVGHVVGYRRFSQLSHAVIVEFDRPSTAPTTLDVLSGETADPGLQQPYAGCVAVQPARHW
jgi:hypothetical protein